MTDQFPPPPPQDPASPPPPPSYAPPAPPAYAPPPAPEYGQPPMQYAQPPVGYGAPIGKVRSTGLAFLWMILTLGIYGFFWMGNTHGELKRHTGQGLGGALAVVIWFFVSPVMLFLTASEVGNMQKAAGREQTVSAITGLWFLLPLAGVIVWFVKTNGAINDYWRSLGAEG